MTDGNHYPGRLMQRHSVAGATNAQTDPRKSFGYSNMGSMGPNRFSGVGQRGQVPAYQQQSNHHQHHGAVGVSPNNPDYAHESPRESLHSNKYPQSQKVYFPSANDLRLGAQGYSSSSDRNKSDDTISRSGIGADTYAGHVPSSNYGGFGDQPSATKRSSKAYGMEHGHWLGMDGSIQNTTLQDTTCLKNLSRDEGLNNYKNWSNHDIGDQGNSRTGKGDWLGLGGGPQAINRSGQHIPHQDVRTQGRYGQSNSPLITREKEGHALSRERRYPQGIQGMQPNNIYSAPGSFPLDETLQLMNQTQNKTIYQVTQSAQRRGGSGSVSDYYKQVFTQKKDGSSTSKVPKRYTLTFKVRYKTDYGESLQVVGSIEELGSWKDYKVPLKWTEGHIWASEPMTIKSNSFFTYKYVVMFQERAIKWERGPHRIADLVILPDVSRLQKPKEANSFSGSPESRHSGHRSQYSMGMQSHGLMPVSTAGSRCSPHHPNISVKNVELRDHWEQFTIRFSVYSSINQSLANDTTDKDNTKEYLRIIGSVPELTKAGTIESGPKRMKKAAKKFRWLFDKYGQEMCPWECQIALKASDFTDAREIIYSYSKGDHGQKDYVYEREPSRIIKIQPPETYRGELGAQRSSQWRNWDKVWIVNGHVEKVDGNFLGELFCTKVGDTGICVGTYPLEDKDAQRLSQAGVSGILNTMTLNDLRQRGVQLRVIQKSYDHRGMKCVKFPVNDIIEKDLQSNLFIAAQHLNNMVNGLGLNVYVHCTSGLSRSPAVVLTYLCLFKKIKCWQTPEEALKFIRTFNPQFNPNMRIIKKCIAANKEFQMSQPENFGSSKRILDSLEDSFYFPNMIIEESHHNPMKLDRLLEIADQIQEEDESFDTIRELENNRQQQDPSYRNPMGGNSVDLSVIKPIAPGTAHQQMKTMTSPRVEASNMKNQNTQGLPLSEFQPGLQSASKTDGTGNFREVQCTPSASQHTLLDEKQIQSKIDQEVAVKLNQQLEELRKKIIEEQEEKMRQAIQAAIQQNSQINTVPSTVSEHPQKQKNPSPLPAPPNTTTASAQATNPPTDATIDNTLAESIDPHYLRNGDADDNYSGSVTQRSRQSTVINAAAAINEDDDFQQSNRANSQYPQRYAPSTTNIEDQVAAAARAAAAEAAEKARKEAKEAEERRIKELERQIEEMRKREDLFMAKLNEREEREKRQRELQEAEDRERDRQKEIDEGKRREEQQRADAEAMARKVREEMEQKMQMDIQRIMEEQMRQNKKQEEEQRLREQKIQKEKQMVEEMLLKQKKEEQQRQEDKLLRKKQKEEERLIQQMQFEQEKKELGKQLQIQQQEIQRLQATLNHDAERIKAFEKLEESQQSLNKLEQARREAEQLHAMSAVEELKKELYIQQERQRQMEAQQAEQLRQKDELLKKIEQSRLDELRRETEARQHQESLLKMEMERKMAAEQLANQQKQAIHDMKLKLEREKEEAIKARLQEQQAALEKEQQLLKAVEEEKEKARNAAAQMLLTNQHKEDTNNQSGAAHADRSVTSLYYQHTQSDEKDQSPISMPEAQEPQLSEPGKSPVQVKKRRDRRNRERSGARNGNSPAKNQDSAQRVKEQQIELGIQTPISSNHTQNQPIPYDLAQNHKIESSLKVLEPNNEKQNSPDVKQQQDSGENTYVPSRKSSLTLLDEEEQLYAAERLQHIKKKKEENAQKPPMSPTRPSKNQRTSSNEHHNNPIQPHQAQTQQSLQESNLQYSPDSELHGRRQQAQNAFNAQTDQHQQQLEELRRLRDTEKRMLMETTRQIQQEKVRQALRQVVDQLVVQGIRKEIRKICVNRIEIETEVQQVLRQRDEEVSQSYMERSMVSGHTNKRYDVDSRRDFSAARNQIPTEKPHQPNYDKINKVPDQMNDSNKMQEEEIEKLRNQRLIEEEKLNLLRLASDAEEQKSIIKCNSRPDPVEITLNETLAAQVREIPEPRITLSAHLQQRLRATEDESLQLDYQGERAEQLYGIQERQTEYYPTKSMTSHNTKGGYTDSYPQDDHSFNQTPTVNESQKRQRQNDRSAAKGNNQYGYDPHNGPPTNHNVIFPNENNSIDLTDLQFEQMCDEFFANGPPIKFKVRRGVKLDEQIQKILRKEKCTLPVIHVRGAIYQIGTQKCICEMKGEMVMVKLQGLPSVPPQRLQRYITENQKIQQQSLCKMMRKTRQNIEDVCQALVKGHKPGEDGKSISINNVGSKPQAIGPTTPQPHKQAPLYKQVTTVQAFGIENRGISRQDPYSDKTSKTNPTLEKYQTAPASHKFQNDGSGQKKNPKKDDHPAAHHQRKGSTGQEIVAEQRIQDRRNSSYNRPSNLRNQPLDPNRSPQRKLNPGKPTHIAPVKQLSLALDTKSFGPSHESARNPGTGKLNPGNLKGSNNLRNSLQQDGGERSTRNQDHGSVTRMSGLRNRTKQLSQHTQPTTKPYAPNMDKNHRSDSNAPRQSNAPHNTSPTKKNKYYVPEGQINLDTAHTRSLSNSQKAQPRRSIQPHPKASKGSAGKALQQKLQSQAPQDQEYDAYGREEKLGNSLRNAEAANDQYGYQSVPVQQNEQQQDDSQNRFQGEYSFRANLDLFHRKYNDSGVHPDQFSHLSGVNGGISDHEDPKNQDNFSQQVQNGYLNALNHLNTQDQQSDSHQSTKKSQNTNQKHQKY